MLTNSTMYLNAMVIPFQELTISNQLQTLMSQLKQQQRYNNNNNNNNNNKYELMMNTVWHCPVKIHDYLSQFYIKHIGENIIRHTPSPTLGDTVMISIANEGTLSPDHHFLIRSNQITSALFPRFSSIRR